MTEVQIDADLFRRAQSLAAAEGRMRKRRSRDGLLLY